MSEWQTEEQKKAAKSISSSFGGPTEKEPEQDTESVLEKVKKWLSSQFSGPSFGEKVSQELKKSQNNQLTIPKK